MPANLTPYMRERLKQRELLGQKRWLRSQPWAHDFSSNDYLGFARSPELRERLHSKVQDLDRIGASGSRLLTGNFPLAESVEKELAEFFGFEKALVFPCGFTLNCNLLAALVQETDVILMDENVHASMKNGLSLAKAPGYFFRHNDLEHLESRLQKLNIKEGHAFVVVESLYSMDGDIVDMDKLLRLCEHYQARLIIDEAHAVGVLGSQGQGLVADSLSQKKVFATVITFGKAFGAHGGALLGGADLIDYLVNFCHSFIYTTGLPAYSFLAIRESLRYFQDHTEARSGLCEKISRFNALLGLEDHPSPIYSFPYANTKKLQEAVRTLHAKDLGILPIYSPTVRKGSERLRVSIHAHNTEEELSLCASELRKVGAY